MLTKNVKVKYVHDGYRRFYYNAKSENKPQQLILQLLRALRAASLPLLRIWLDRSFSHDRSFKQSYLDK